MTSIQYSPSIRDNMARLGFWSILCLSFLSLLLTVQSQQETLKGTETEQKSYQERHMIMVPPKQESCFFVENLYEGFVLNIHYVVLNTKNGVQLDVSMRLRDPDKRMII